MTMTTIKVNDKTYYLHTRFDYKYQAEKEAKRICSTGKTKAVVIKNAYGWCVFTYPKRR